MPHRIKALLIDDLDTKRHILANDKQLRPYNDNLLVIDYVRGIHHGMEAILQNNHDIYLLENNLIDNSGIDFILNIRQQGIDSPFIIITDDANSDTVRSYEVQQLERVYQLDHNDLEPESIYYSILNALEHTYIINMESEHQNLLKKRDRYIKQLMLLNQIDEEINSQFNLKHVLDIAMDASLRLSGAQSGYIALLQPDGKLLIHKHIGQANRVPADRVVSDHYIYEIIQENSNLLIDLTQEKIVKPVFENSQSVMILSLQSRSHQSIGVLLLETTQVNYFTQENFEFIKRLSKRLAVALEHSQLYKELEVRYTELEQLYRKISRLEQLKTDMIHIAAHDIRTPVNAIMNYVEVLQRGELSKDKATELLRWIWEAAQDAENITKNILSLEQIENLQHQVLVPTDLCKTTMLSYSRFVQQAIDAKITMEINVPSTPVFVAGLDYLLQEAIANFISNAIKYTPEGGTVQINLYIENGEAVLSIVDNGYGIPDEQQAALFQPFYRAKNNVTHQISGTGLGLYLIKRIVELFNGQVFFTSKFGEGSTFGLKLPIYFR